jgi:hypothetical protein
MIVSGNQDKNEPQSLDGVPSGVDDSMVGHTSRSQSSTKFSHISVLILALVVLTIGCVLEFTWDLLPCVPSSDVGGNSTDRRGRTSTLVGVGEFLCTGLKVGVPSEPATVSSVNVHGDVGEVQVAESVLNTFSVSGS